MTNKEKARERREKRLQEISLLRTLPYSDQQRWWSSENIAVVTGANRGIGFEIARQLAGQGLTVVLTARNAETGLEAAKVLQNECLKVEFHQLDVTDSSSIREFGQWIKETFGGLDVLVNNAGVNYNLGSDNSVEFAQTVVATNYYGTKNMTEAMIPLMRLSRQGTRIVNVSSRLGRLNGRRNRIANSALREALANPDTLTEELIDDTVSSFLNQVEDGTWESGGWPQTFTDYSVSKLAVNAYTRVKAKELSERPEGEKVYVSCFCPGWVKTAMTGYEGNMSAEDAADTGVWLALLLSDHAVTGKFFAERREINF
ncbi:PREDICTED: (+)-neomenthol dehydrogenase [Tarenaya hassleriana]|uniref:(+)-neomenthol dehydrogenase n=1 Tax=Tarenaya hassleriana TaxID=28532 RepID=UPI00053C8A5E|nr:PREDICTED: (+)-neomenthol dehydrogenase [Tarenaya hassleriana]